MADIRERVEEDKGILKKIQSFIPGFRGYRKREDIRDADKMLRMQLADKLGKQRNGLEECRGMLVQGGAYKELDLIGGLISNFKKVEGQVAHAEFGYSGLVADINIKEDELDRLYEFDAAMLDHIVAISASIDSLKGSLMAADTATSHKDIMNIKARITDFENQFDRRMRVIEGTEV
jgi:hypothetical protein